MSDEEGLFLTQSSFKDSETIDDDDDDATAATQMYQVDLDEQLICEQTDFSQAEEQRKRLLVTLKQQRKEREKALQRLIEAILSMAIQLDVETRRLNIADTTLSVSGIVGASLFITGFGLSFVTAGASLGLVIAGGAIGGATGVGGASSQVSRYFLTKTKWKCINEEIRNLNIQDENIQETIWKIMLAVAGQAICATKVVKSGLKFAPAVDDVIMIAQGGSAIVSSKAFFKTMGTVSKVIYSLGVGASVVGIGMDIYTIVDRAQKIHKNQPAQAAEEMRVLAYRLMGPHKHQPSTCERRMIEMKLRSTWATL